MSRSNLSPIATQDANSAFSNARAYQSLSGGDNPYSPTTQPPAHHSPHSLASPPLTGDSRPASRNDRAPSAMSRRGPPPGDAPSPPASSRGSTGTSLYNGMSPEERRTRHRQWEESLQPHYSLLLRWLGPSVRDAQRRDGPMKARDKLVRLSATQFQELSTDVYDELRRREDTKRRRDVPPSLPPKNGFHPKRNQARQKLSSLPEDRFRQLATDVFLELERRVPRFGGRSDGRSRAVSPASSVASGRSGMSRLRGGPGGRPPMGRPYGDGPLSPDGYGKPAPKQLQSNTIIPNKGTMVEDDDSEKETETTYSESKRGSDAVSKEVADGYLAQISTLEAKVEELEGQIRTKETELQESQESHGGKDAQLEEARRELENVRTELEAKLEAVHLLNDTLQTELDELNASTASNERSLREEVEMARAAEREARAAMPPPGVQDGGEWQQKYEDLEREMLEQRRTIDDVRNEASTFLQEMRVLSERSDAAQEAEEKLVNQVATLEDQLKLWKTRYALARTHLKHVRSTSVGLNPGAVQPIGPMVKDTSLISPDGGVQDIHLTKFQLAIDELLQAARQPHTPDSVVSCTKTVVLTVRRITEDVESHSRNESSASSGSNNSSYSAPHSSSSSNPPASPSQTGTKQQAKLKARVSATANNLITAAKNHAASSGLSPVSLLDAAASHLTSAVVELVRLVKIRPTSEGEIDFDPSELPIVSRNSSISENKNARGMGPMGGLGMSTMSTRQPLRKPSSSSISSKTASAPQPQPPVPKSPDTVPLPASAGSLNARVTSPPPAADGEMQLSPSVYTKRVKSPLTRETPSQQYTKGTTAMGTGARNVSNTLIAPAKNDLVKSPMGVASPSGANVYSGVAPISPPPSTNGTSASGASGMNSIRQGLSRMSYGSDASFGSNYGPGPDVGPDAEGLEDLKASLEARTTALVAAIQPMVSAVRSSSSGTSSSDLVQGYIGDISLSVEDLVGQTRAAVAALPANGALRVHVLPVLAVLEDSRRGLLKYRDGTWEDLRRKVPGLAFKIARATKELVTRIDRIEAGDLTEQTPYVLNLQ